MFLVLILCFFLFVFPYSLLFNSFFKFLDVYLFSSEIGKEKVWKWVGMEKE